MFKIYDGREHFYQWDLDRQLIINDPAIKQVHFCNRTSDCSLVVETYEQDGLLVADVPNLLLQTDWDVRAYAYDGNATLHEQWYEVKARTKPTDYIYTETEIKNYDDLVERIEQIEEKGVSDEKINSAVNEYLEANPIEHPVESINGKTGAVELTAADVGALSADTEIPSTAGLATEKYVDDAIANLDIPEADVDLSDYYTKAQVDKKIEDIELTPGPAGKDGEDGKDYVLTDADKQEIANMVEATGGMIDLTDYYTKNDMVEVLQPYALKNELPNVSIFVTAEEVDAQIQEALAAIVDGEEVAY